MTDEIGHSDDELLSAYIDGALPAERAAALEQRLKVESALAMRLNELERANTAVRDAYAHIAREPLPNRVLELIDRAEGIAPQSDADVVDLAARRRRRALGFAPLPLSLAAGVALAVGVSFGYVFALRSPPPEAALMASAGAVATGTPLYEALETTASATARQIEPGVAVTPILTFQSTDGDYCRHIDIESQRGSGEALACRRAGTWRVEAVTFTAQAPTAEGEFRPAARRSIIDDAIDERMQGEPLDASTEATLIGRRWSNRAP